MTSFMTFDGEEGRVVVSGYRGVSGKRERSISFWIQTSQESGTICWWGDDLTAQIKDGEQNRVRLFKGHVELFGRGSSLRSASVVNDNNFHHVVFTWTKLGANFGHEDFQLTNVYIDNVLDNGVARGDSHRPIAPDGTEFSLTAINTPSEEQVIIGARPDPAGGLTEFFQGALDEFAVYNVVMSTATISGAYNDGTRGADLLSLGQSVSIQFWYRMGDDAGDVVPVLPVPSGTLVDQTNFQRNGIVSSGTSISG